MKSAGCFTRVHEQIQSCRGFCILSNHHYSKARILLNDKKEQKTKQPVVQCHAIEDIVKIIFLDKMKKFWKSIIRPARKKWFVG